MHMLCRFGAPEVPITNQGHEFVNVLIQRPNAESQLPTTLRQSHMFGISFKTLTSLCAKGEMDVVPYMVILHTLQHLCLSSSSF